MWSLTISTYGPKWLVFNTTNGQGYARFDDEAEARNCMDWLNNGGGMAV